MDKLQNENDSLTNVAVL